jgi:Protein of unknown function (DUF4058)
MQPYFPGMNPYLENPDTWAEVHFWLIAELARSLNPVLTPKYRAAVEKRVYTDAILVGIPDVSVFQTGALKTRNTAVSTVSKPVKVNVPVTEEFRENYLEIRQVATGQVVTVVEVLSPKNKRAGEGREKYSAKRRKVLNSASHLVEIDLLRSGEPQAIAGIVASDYRILVSRADERPEAELYPFNLRDSLPSFYLPLQPEDSEPVICLEEILNQVYDAAGLHLTTDYSLQPIPTVSEIDFQWIQTLGDYQ